MAREKFRVGDSVRLVRNIDFGSAKLQRTTLGTIRHIESGLFVGSKYLIRWQGTNFDMTMNGSRDFVLAQVDDSSGVFKE